MEFIKNTKDIHQSNLKCLIYGESGAGKTYLASTLTEPTLIISAESGLVSLTGSAIDYVDITKDKQTGKTLDYGSRIDFLFELYQYLQSDEAKERYQNIFIDSLTEIADTIQRRMDELHEGYKVWSEYSKKIDAVVRKFRDLPHYNVFFTATEESDQDETKLWHYRPYIPADKIKMALPYMFDEVFRVVKEDEDKRFLVTKGTKASIAKDRSGRLDAISPCNLQVVLDQIRGEEEQ